MQSIVPPLFGVLLSDQLNEPLCPQTSESRLQDFSRYRISVVASSVSGDGPATATEVVTRDRCKSTPEHLPDNFFAKEICKWARFVNEVCFLI